VGDLGDEHRFDPLHAAGVLARDARNGRGGSLPRPELPLQLGSIVWVKPVPTPPANDSVPSGSRTARASEPTVPARRPSPGL
jgi:hypothetical protein